MIKICFVIPRAYYLFNSDIKNFKDKIGGAQKQTYILSTEIAKNQNFDVHFCVADIGQPKIEVIDKVTLWNSFNFNDIIFKRFIILYTTLKKINADYYILRASDFGTAVISLIIKYILRKKILYMVASDAETNFKTHKKMSGFLSAFFMIFTYKFADIITVQSVQQNNLFTKNYKRKPNAIVKNIIEITKSETLKIKDKILWIGRLDKIKNPELLLNLAEKFPTEKFVMIAPVVRDYVEFGNNFIRKAANYQNITVVDFVNPNEIQKYFEKAKIYVMTSDTEGFSNTMLEAMLSKCPILSYKVNNDDIFGKFEIGLWANGNPEKLYSDFQRLIQDSELRKKLGQNGFDYLKQNHDKQQIINEFTKLIQF
jgi:glycosyltransferase involved in cell wall biosynthesis